MSCVAVGESAAGISSHAANSLGVELNNLNSLLPPGISVGYLNETSTPMVCLGKHACYKNKPMLHRILSAFDPNDYVREANAEAEDDEDDRVPVTIEDVRHDKIKPGEALKCYWDEELYDAIYLTKEQNLEEGWIGIYFPDDSSKRWIPHDLCYINEGGVADELLWSCDGLEGGGEGGEYGVVDNPDSSDSWCGYLVKYNNPLFHRAFGSLLKKEHSSPDNRVAGGKGKTLFTYTDFEGIERKDENEEASSPNTKANYVLSKAKYVDVGRTPIPPGLDVSEFGMIYKHVAFESDTCRQIDDKYRLFQLYKDDEDASRVFPKSYASYGEALDDTMGDDGVIFYVKDSGGTRGEDIEILTRAELAGMVETGEASDEEDADGGVIVQQAVTDLFTVGGDGPIAGRRFDIRFFVIIARGRAWLHSNMWCKWVVGPSSPRYDPLDTDVGNQVPNLAVYGGGDTARLVFPDVRDAVTWKDGGGSGPGRHGGVPNPHGWRDAVAEALDAASGAVFAPSKKLTAADPSRYLLIGGDAMIREDGSAVLVEFNPWCDLASKYERLEECLAGGVCRRMVVLVDEDEEDSACGKDGYHVTEKTPMTDILSSEVLSEVLRDTASLVMGVQQPDEIELFREIYLKR